MGISKNSIIASTPVEGTGEPFRAVTAATGDALEPELRFTGDEQIEQALAAAADAFDVYRSTGNDERAAFLDRAAERIEEIGDEIVARAQAESGLSNGRLNGELARTTNQLRLFGHVLREGSWEGARIDPAQPDRQPLPRADIRQRRISLGPVAVFGASNFPLAFSTAGGDTASALAAGSPVIVKAHNAHPGTAALVGQAVARAVADHDLPGGVFSQVYGPGRTIGQRLVADPRVKAVGFTGSRQGGLALVSVAQSRPEPIPVYAEMSSVNPVVVLPTALARDPRALARDYVASLTLGSGQFCTNPGILYLPEGEDAAAFVSEAAAQIAAADGQTMLTAGIREAYEAGVERRTGITGVERVAEGHARPDKNAPAPVLFRAPAELKADGLTDEVFGSAGLIVSYHNVEQLASHLELLEGQLTATLLAEPEDYGLATAVLPVLERKVGRILFNGWPTGVEVGHAMVHGGPFPATSDARTTSVGTLAIQRFLRPVAYQDVPAELLPDVLRSDNPKRVPQRIDGVIHLPK